MNSSSPLSKKRSLSESFQLKPIKIHKSGEYCKENIAPQFIGNISQQFTENCGSNNLQYYVKATPKKALQFNEDPVTPNTNIKLLTSLAATLDYANCNTPKSTRYEQARIADRSCDENIDLPPVLRTSRKEKSLALICFKFLNIYPLYPEPDAQIIVSLDEASKTLKVERRRLYDIVNVFESIDMLTKRAKNRYIWYGKNYLLKALQRIKAAASEENIEKKLQYVLKDEECVPQLKHTCILDEVQKFSRNFECKNESLIQELIAPVSPLSEVRKEKSLALMSQKFLMLFLVSPSRVISLGVAAKVLNGFQKNDKGAQIKTQIRRLYDIANVLSSLGLIQKETTKAVNGKKPAFKYIGPDLESSKGPLSSIENIQTNRQKLSKNKVKPRSLIRHSSFQEICAVAELEHQKLCLDEAPKSAPPFKKSVFKLGDSKTNFSDLNFSKVSHQNKLNELYPKKSHINQPRIALHSIQSDCISIGENKSQSNTTKETLSTVQNVRVLNVPKTVISNNGPVYILNGVNCDVPASFNSSGTFLLLNNYVTAHPPKEDIKEKHLENKVIPSQTIELSPLQRDVILRSLNISLSAGQVAAIQLEGAAQSSTSNLQCNNNRLKIINKSVSKIVPTNQANLGSLKNATLNVESNGSSNSTRNNSPNSIPSRYGSPISIPSGYTTPVPSSSLDINLFPSSSQVDYILKKIEEPASNLSQSHHVVTGNMESKKLPNLNNKMKPKQNNCHFNYTLFPEQGLQHLTDSCSSESLNDEVSNIMKETPLGVVTNSARCNSFLIDEKTILSPIKKPDQTTKVLTPSPLMTPPYANPDTIFLYNPCMKFLNNVIVDNGKK